jgi:predicted  nucleic acid-binding Zn-ribbon protein
LEPNLERLMRLQDLCLAIEEQARRLSAMPGRQQDLEQSLARHRADVAKARDELADSQKQRRKLEGELQTVETRITKYQGQLMEVKTNKEYTAMLHEIETVKEERGGIETRILQAMDLADTLEGSIKRMESALSEEEQRVSAGLAQLKQEEQKALDRKASLEGDRSGVEGELPPELVSEFARVSRARGGVAVARVVAGLCQGCSVRIQPRIFQQVRRNEGILRCDSCRRFLYYIEEKVDEPPPGP